MGTCGKARPKRAQFPAASFLTTGTGIGTTATAHFISRLAHLGSIAYRLGRRLEFDPHAERFVCDEAADAMLTRAYHEPNAV
ncbi:MAG: hypothetical protein AAF961_05620 [Planctomycetota bacterium]